VVQARWSGPAPSWRDEERRRNKERPGPTGAGARRSRSCSQAQGTGRDGRTSFCSSADEGFQVRDNATIVHSFRACFFFPLLSVQ
jgi:hypothetical protein